jgi:hypothetical protein
VGKSVPGLPYLTYLCCVRVSAATVFWDLWCYLYALFGSKRMDPCLEIWMVGGFGELMCVEVQVT